MTDKIKHIFERNIYLLEQADKAVYYFRKQMYDRALGIIADSIDILKKTIGDIISDKDYFNTVSTDSVLEMFSAILDAYKKENFILLADLFEMQMVTFLCRIQELIIGKEEIGFDEEQYYENLKVLKDNCMGLDESLINTIDPQPLLQEGYRVELTSCGLMTLVAENNGAQFYFHTNGRVQAEAFILASHWYKEKINEYILYGLGFGYHIKELLSLSEQAEITVYEGDLNVIMLACAFTKIKDIFESKRVKLIYDPKYSKLKRRLKNLSDSEAFCVHYPSYQNIRTAEGKIIMESHVSWPINV
ncbi:MAG TPA: hypothetical protein PK304_06725 [Mobilitalea sp.]|nr:hypothetical protein [Mobilitalea sp.]